MCRIAQWNHTFADKHRVPPPGYCPGQKVWLSTRDLPLQVDSRKLAPTFIGRYEIDKISNPRCPAETSPFPRSSHNPRLSSEAIRHQSTPRCYRTYTEFPHKSGTMTVPSVCPRSHLVGPCGADGRVLSWFHSRLLFWRLCFVLSPVLRFCFT